MPAEITALYPVLIAKDVNDFIRFYQKMGFNVIFQDDPKEPKYAGLKRDQVTLHLQWGDPTQWQHQGDRPAYRFYVTEVDELYAEFMAAGGILLPTGSGPWVNPGDTPWGTREYHLRDPGGNVLQFYRVRT